MKAQPAQSHPIALDSRNFRARSAVVSVIIPCRNERDHIEACIESVLNLEPPPGDFEIIVVDGMSDDGTREVLKELAQVQKRLRIIENPQRTTACALNLGIREARGKYIAVMGAHNQYADDYLTACFDVLENTGAENVGGSMQCVGETWLQRAIAIAHHSPFSVGGARWHDTSYEGRADTVFGGFYRREVFDRIGFFDESLIRNQDDELNLRLTRAGATIWHSPRVRSWYHPRSSLLSLFRQYLQYGYWKVRIIQKHRVPASIRHLVPGSFLLALLFLPLIGLVSSFALWLWLALIVLYTCCTVGASIVTAAKKGWIYLPILPIVFTCYHFGYGLGFLKGILDFVVLRRTASASFTVLTRASTSPLQRL